MTTSISSPGIKRIYLDVCVLCRPFDDQRQMRIALETDAVALILNHVRQGNLSLIISKAHDLEINALKKSKERNQLKELLNNFGLRYSYELSAVQVRAEMFVAEGLGPADAAHLAFAEQAQADFLTVDDRLLRQCHRVRTSIWYGKPPIFCERENLT